MEQRVMSVLFYGAMLMVMATCVANWPSATWSTPWVEAAGTWFSGVASFAAVAAALYIAGSQERKRAAERKEDYSRRRKLVAFKLVRKSHDYRRSTQGALADFENGEFRDIISSKNVSAIMERLLQGIRYEPFDPLSELVYIHEVSLVVIAMEANLDAYFSTIARIQHSEGRDVQYWFSTAIGYARSVEGQAGVLATFAERCVETE